MTSGWNTKGPTIHHYNLANTCLFGFSDAQRKLSVIFAIERNIFAIMRKYKYNSLSNGTMFTILFTLELVSYARTHTSHIQSWLCAYVCM